VFSDPLTGDFLLQLGHVSILPGLSRHNGGVSVNFSGHVDTLTSGEVRHHS
jgi:hypothetical protein